MAYAALVSLSQTLEHILCSHDQFRFLHEEQQIRYLQEKLGFLLSFLEDSSPKNREATVYLEGRIRDVAYDAEDMIELHLLKQSLLRIRRISTGRSKFVPNQWPRMESPSRVWQENKNEERKRILSGSSNHGAIAGLYKVIEKLTLSSEEVNKMDINRIECLQPSSATDGSLKSSSSKQSNMVVYGDDLMPIKDLATGPSSKFQSTPLFGAEDIEETLQMRRIDYLEDVRPNFSLPTKLNKSAMVGFDDDLLQIKEKLIGQSSALKIISIVGMGGIGKSMLATNIYNDPYVVHQFYVRAWTTASQQYYMKALLIKLLSSMTDHGSDLKDMETEGIKEKVYRSLKGNRYLIVIDDIWDTNAWDELKMLFPNDNNGSRIILTTRQSGVAVYASSSNHVHRLNFLSLEHSWDLLCQKVFGEECCPPELEEIGKQIAERCKGLPLALVVIGGQLSKAQRTRSYWEYVAKNVISAANRSYDDYMEILSWSYIILPYHLRPCFLYMGVFPEDYLIHVSNLVRLWAAEGFLKPIVSKSTEQVAYEYLEDLINRNMIIAHQRDICGRVKTCIIHDLMRDLCMRKAQEEIFLHTANDEVKFAPEFFKRCRRLSVHNQQKLYHFAGMCSSTIRSLLHFRGDLSSFLTCFQLLKVLYACDITFDKFPVEIVTLCNLKYLAFIYKGIGEIPASISNLQNLETLIILQPSGDGPDLVLPVEIWEMPRLRHLLFDCAVLPSMPPDAQNQNLQTISGILHFICSNVGHPNLKTLRVSYSSTLNWSMYGLENLAHLHQLENLRCRFLSYTSPIPVPVDLAFPSKLRKLTLISCKISWEKLSIIGSISNLEVLKLKYCDFEGSTWKTNGEEFHQLKFLLVACNNPVYWEIEEAHFPRLLCLVLGHCWSIESFPSQMAEVPTLQQIVLVECSSSVQTLAYTIEQEQHEYGNEGFQVHIYSHFRKYKVSSGISFRKMYGGREKPHKSHEEGLLRLG